MVKGQKSKAKYCIIAGAALAALTSFSDAQSLKIAGFEQPKSTQTIENKISTSTAPTLEFQELADKMNSDRIRRGLEPIDYNNLKLYQTKEVPVSTSAHSSSASTSTINISKSTQIAKTTQKEKGFLTKAKDSVIKLFKPFSGEIESSIGYSNDYTINEPMSTRIKGASLDERVYTKVAYEIMAKNHPAMTKRNMRTGKVINIEAYTDRLKAYTLIDFNNSNIEALYLDFPIKNQIAQIGASNQKIYWTLGADFNGFYIGAGHMNKDSNATVKIDDETSVNHKENLYGYILNFGYQNKILKFDVLWAPNTYGFGKDEVGSFYSNKQDYMNGSEINLKARLRLKKYEGAFGYEREQINAITPNVKTAKKFSMGYNISDHIGLKAEYSRTDIDGSAKSRTDSIKAFVEARFGGKRK